MPISESPDRHEDDELSTKNPDIPAKDLAMLAAMEAAASELEDGMRGNNSSSMEDAFGILSRAVAVARGDTTYEDAAGTEWPIGDEPSDDPGELKENEDFAQDNLPEHNDSDE